jgi:hypothetical protein
MDNISELNRSQLFESNEDWSEKKPLPLNRAIPQQSKFPLLALGSELMKVAELFHEFIEAPDGICGQSVLAAVCLATQAHGQVSVDGRLIPLSNNFISVAESGERKSAVDRLALLPVREHQQKLNEQYKVEFSKYKLELIAFKAVKDRIIAKPNSKNKTQDELRRELENIGVEPKAPMTPMILMDEPTYEGLVKQLEFGQPSIGIFSDEGGRLIGGHGMNQDNQLKTIAGFSELWDGKEISRVRAGDGSVLMYGKRMSMHLMVQPPVASQLFDNSMMVGQGFLNRCLISYPASTAGNRSYKEKNIKNHPGNVPNSVGFEFVCLS